MKGTTVEQTKTRKPLHPPAHPQVNIEMATKRINTTSPRFLPSYPRGNLNLQSVQDLQAYET